MPLQTGLKLAHQLIEHEDISAVVAVNRVASEGLVEALLKLEYPLEKWPAVVSFDAEITDSLDGIMNVMTALLLPWEEIGHEAANLLWERSQGRLSGRQKRLVKMDLIQRLSCRREWHRAPVAALLAPS